ncbi:MAG: hypothetical protein KKA81_14200, partial [Bacteroidetes bacterium]|nr:hypothetical protein [Bacteroidota bacterium]
MKTKVFFFIITAWLFVLVKGYSQPQVDSILVKRFYYTCKVWGYVKYFHTAMADCSIKWDSVLIHTLPQVESAGSWQAFNDILLNMVNVPGEMAIPTTPPPQIPDSLFFNLHTQWFNDTAIHAPVRSILDTIKARFRPQDNCYVQTGMVGNPDFSADTAYNRQETYPSKERRMLALFRYWNNIEYFFPYTDVMDQEWDITLNEMIPWFYMASTGTEYAVAVLRLAHFINDTHGYTNSMLAYQYLGSYFPKFFPEQAEGQMVVSRVSGTVTNVFPGDIILEINGIPIEEFKDSLRPLIVASNESRMQYNLNNTVVRGQTSSSFELLLQDESGTRLETTPRSYSYNAYFSLIANNGPIWYDTLLPGGCNYGYVDMGRLEQSSVGDMFQDLWETDAIIFDIRSYPKGTLWTIVNYLFPQSFCIASFTKPNADYPGTISWEDEYIGYPQAELYQGSIIVLFNEKTLSQAEYTCMGLDAHPNCIKIGSQTAGADGNVSEMFLPGQISTFMTGLGTFYPDHTPTQRIGIVPDHEVNITIQGLREQRDEVLEYALNCQLVGTEEPLKTTGCSA